MDTHIGPDVFQPGLRIKLLAMSSAKSRVAASLIGAKTGKYLVIEPALINGLPARMEQGAEWTASFISNGGIYNFNTKVIGSSRLPVPLVFISYPDKGDCIDLRRNRRFPVALTAEFEIPEPRSVSETGPVKGVVRDISEGGCMLISPVSLEADRYLRLKLELPDGEPLDGMLSEVRNCRRIGEAFALGLSFAPGVAEDDYVLVKKFIGQLATIPLRF